DRVAKFIERENLFESSSRLLLAVSGGRDSTVLIHVLMELGYRPYLAHYNYMLRGEESMADVEFLKELADELGLELYLDGCTYEESQSLKNEGNLQARARAMRYDFLEQIARQKGCNYILTAHHADDALETFFINLLRGSGLRGLRGISPKNESKKICRPLIEISQADIQDYAEQNEIAWREDLSNAQNDYLRNQIRHQLIPTFRAIEPLLTNRSVSTFKHLRNYYLLASEATQLLWNEVALTDQRGWIHLSKEKLSLRPVATAHTVLHHFLSDWGFDRELRRQLLEASSDRLLRTETHHALIKDDVCIIASLPAEKVFEYAMVKDQNSELHLDDFTILFSEKSSRPAEVRTPPNLLFLPTRLTDQLRIRRPKAGDRFTPFGMQGKSQKLQDYFTNEKIDRLERLHTWLLVDNDDEILWIMGHRAAEKTRLKNEDHTTVKMQFKRLPRSLVDSK
ncbi:MAG: tRNA lysidine(34) synthetase TilS, partial [Bacteroidota bacterium]